MPRRRYTNEDLRAEIDRLRSRNNWLSEKLAEAERRLGCQTPIIALEQGGRKVRLLIFNGQPAVFADDLLPFVHGAPGPEHRGEKQYQVSVQRLRRMGLGAREVTSVRRRDIAAMLGITERSVSLLLGVSARAHFIGVVTPLGVRAIAANAPEFCEWVEHKAFPQAIERLGRGARHDSNHRQGEDHPCAHACDHPRRTARGMCDREAGHHRAGCRDRGDHASRSSREPAREFPIPKRNAEPPRGVGEDDRSRARADYFCARATNEH